MGYTLLPGFGNVRISANLSVEMFWKGWHITAYLGVFRHYLLAFLEFSRVARCVFSSFTVFLSDFQVTARSSMLSFFLFFKFLKSSNRSTKQVDVTIQFFLRYILLDFMFMAKSRIKYDSDRSGYLVCFHFKQ